MKSFTTASVLSLASSAVAINFQATAVHSGDFRVHQKQINAQQGRFWVDRATETFCPDNIEKAGGCPKSPNNETDVLVFTGPAPGQSNLNLDVQVPGGQYVFIDPLDGHLGFSTAHSGAAQDLMTTGFTYVPLASQGGSEEQGTLFIPGNATACPDPAGGYEVFSSEFYKGKVDKAQCIEIGLATLQTTDKAAAWEYV